MIKKWNTLIPTIPPDEKSLRKRPFSSVEQIIDSCSPGPRSQLIAGFSFPFFFVCNPVQVISDQITLSGDESSWATPDGGEKNSRRSKNRSLVKQQLWRSPQGNGWWPLSLQWSYRCPLIPQFAQNIKQRPTFTVYVQSSPQIWDTNLYWDNQRFKIIDISPSKFNYNWMNLLHKSAMQMGLVKFEGVQLVKFTGTGPTHRNIKEGCELFLMCCF